MIGMRLIVEVKTDCCSESDRCDLYLLITSSNYITSGNQSQQRYILRICQSEQPICIRGHTPPLRRLPSSICLWTRIDVTLFKPILPFSSLVQKCSCGPFHFIFHKQKFLFPSILLCSGPNPMNTLNFRQGQYKVKSLEGTSWLTFPHGIWC